MAFNVSRFLVRVRQFWTRERLVPVLGITALFLFLLNIYTYVNSFFEKKPIIAVHTLANGDALLHSDGESADFMIWHGTDEGLHRHRLELERHRHHLDRLRENLERHKHELERHGDRLHRKIRIHRDQDGHSIIVHEDDNEVREYVIDGIESDGEDVRIEVNGKRIVINGSEVEI